MNEYNGEVNLVIMERDEDMSYEFFKKLLSYGEEFVLYYQDEDMSYEFFKKLLSYGEEFVLYYQDRKFYISQRKDLGELYFTVSEEDYHIFYSPKELLSAPLIDGETLLERWNDLVVY